MSTESQQPTMLRASVQDRFRRVAMDPDRERKSPVGPESAKRLGYGCGEVDALPSSLTESFCGAGNPFLLGQPQSGETVLDLGCGAGFDTLLTAQTVGRNGKVSGLDMTPKMVAKAGTNAEILGSANVEFFQGEIDSLPVANASVDLVTFKGVFNRAGPSLPSANDWPARPCRASLRQIARSTSLSVLGSTELGCKGQYLDDGEFDDA